MIKGENTGNTEEPNLDNWVCFHHKKFDIDLAIVSKCTCYSLSCCFASLSIQFIRVSVLVRLNRDLHLPWYLNLTNLCFSFNIDFDASFFLKMKGKTMIRGWGTGTSFLTISRWSWGLCAKRLRERKIVARSVSKLTHLSNGYLHCALLGSGTCGVHATDLVSKPEVLRNLSRRKIVKEFH